jgi:regulatory protein
VSLTADRAGSGADPVARLQHALDLAFRYLGRRDRTVLEMRRYLEGKRVEPATIEAALASLHEQGYLDDARFARRFAADKRELDHWGAERIERRLATLGIDREVLASSLGTPDRDDELAAALEILRRRFPALAEDPRDRRRALGVLVRKGYDVELAGDAIRAHARGE